MRILLASSASYVPPRGGSTRSNLVWLEHLAAHGHPCRVVASSAERNTSEKQQLVAKELADQQVEAPTTLEGAEFAHHGQIEVFSVVRPSQRAEILRAQIREFQPDWVLVSSEDLGQVLLREAQASAPGRVVYLAHTPQFYPFGPASWSPNREGTELFSQCAAILSIGPTPAASLP